MATATDTAIEVLREPKPSAAPSQVRYEPEDLLKIHDRPMPELIDGQLVERPLMGQKADLIATTLCFFLLGFIRERGLGGWVNGAQSGYQIFPDDPKKVRVPDVSYTPRDRVPSGGPAEGHARVAPTLVVEVVSPNDEALYLDRKIEDFLAAGVPLVWIIFPNTQVVQVYRIDGTGTRLRVGDTLDGEAVLPGFRCEVAKLFEGLA